MSRNKVQSSLAISSATAEQHPPKLNLLALPSLPGYYLAIMALVILGALVASSLPGSPFRAGPILVAFYGLLVVRDFLIQPEREAHRHGLMRPAADQYGALRGAIAELARHAGLRRGPQLRLAQTPGALFALGTFRHNYLAVAPDLAAVLETDLLAGGKRRRRAEAALLHEIQHVIQRDLIYVGLARSFLRVGTALCGFGLWLLMGIAVMSFMFPITPLLAPEYAARLEQLQPGLGQIWEVAIPPGLAEAAAQPPELGLALLYLLNAFLPLALTIGLMFLLIWPRLLRVRELYADAGVVASQGGDRAMWNALSYYGARIRLIGSTAGLRNGWTRLTFALAVVAGRRWGQRLLRFHPTTAERRECLERPAAAFSSPRASGMLAGLLSTLLDLLLVGAFSVFYAVQVPGAIPVVVGMLAASFTLLPDAVEGRTARHAMIRSAMWIIGLVLVWRMGWHLLNLGFLWLGVLFAPQFMSDVLSSFVHNMAGVLVTVPEGIVAPSALLSIAIKSTFFWFYLFVLIALTLLAAVALEWRMRRMALTWYRLPGSVRMLKWVLIGITLWTLTLAAGLWLPLLALVAPVSPTDVYPIVGWAALAMNLLVVVLGALLFAFGHWRYARHCPTCRSAVPGWFSLGHACPTCGKRLWPELIAHIGL
jgi:hypothetical protein